MRTIAIDIGFDGERFLAGIGEALRLSERICARVRMMEHFALLDDDGDDRRERTIAFIQRTAARDFTT